MFLKIAIRNFKRAKVMTILNILGLAMGISSAILIFLLVSLHLSFDDYHKNAASIYRIVTDYNYQDGSKSHTPGISSPLASVLRSDTGLFKDVALINTYREVQVTAVTGQNSEPEKFREENTVAFVEPSFFSIFDYKFIDGNPVTAMGDSLSAVITENYAQKYFPGVSAIGKTLRLDNKLSVTVAGIVGNIPENTFFRQQVFVSYKSRAAFEPLWHSNWNDTRSSTQCFVLTNADVSKIDVDKQLKVVVGKYLDKDDVGIRVFAAQRLSDMHLNTNYDGYLSKTAVISFSLVGVFLILTASVNFVNMSTAQSLTRTKEVGVKKTLGASGKQLIIQFIMETGVVVFISLLFAMVITWLVIPYMNTLFLDVFSISLTPTFSLIVFLIAIYLITVLLSGLYPSLVLAGFGPIEALSQRINSKKLGKVSVKRGLVIFQFFTTYVLIISGITMNRQMHFTRNASMGFNKDGILIVPVPTLDAEKMERFKHNIQALKSTEDISFLFTPPAYRSNIINSFFYQKQENGKDITFNVKKGDDHYVSTFGLKLLSGANFSTSDSSKQILVNEALVKAVPGANTSNIIGKSIIYNNQNYRVQGVLQDFHVSSLRNKIMPCGIIDEPSGIKNCAIKLSLNNVNGSMKDIESIWNQCYPEYVYEVSFLADHLGTFYVVEEIVQKLINAFSIIAIVISSLGLYGLISFMAVQRRKEIGIRKTLGASVLVIINLFVKELLRPTLLGFAIAAPITYYGMGKWLSGYQAHVSIGIDILVISLLIPLGIALITVGNEAVKAALVRPIKSLRNE